MDVNAGKGTNRDLIAIEKLDALNYHTNTNTQRQELFNLLLNCKTDLSFWLNLSSRDCLQLDYKDFNFITEMNTRHSVGVSSVLLSIHDLITKEDFIDSFIEYIGDVSEDIGILPREGSNKDFFMIMSMISSTANISRELLIASTDYDKLQDISSYLQTQHQLLQLDVISIPQAFVSNWLEKKIFIIAFKQGNVKISRKQMAVYLQEYYTKT